MKITISTWHPSAIIPLQDCFSKYSGYNFEWISSFEATVDLNTDNVGVLVKVMELIFRLNSFNLNVIVPKSFMAENILLVDTQHFNQR